MHSSKLNGGGVPPNATLSPLHQFLTDCHAELRNDHRGSIADYIPELTKADPNHFGVSLATIDGHVYEVGNSAVPFTIQSISKPFVFALALQTLGADKVEAVIGVEPSGDTFNSIRLRADNRPYNPMVNAGAIATPKWTLTAILTRKQTLTRTRSMLSLGGVTDGIRDSAKTLAGKLL